MCSFLVEPLNRRRIVDHNGGDFSVINRLLLADDYIISVKNAGFNHAVPLDLKQKSLSISRKISRQGYVFFDVLLGEQRFAGGDPADKRNRSDTAGFRGNGASLILENADPRGPFGVRGMAEMPFLPLAPAVVAAVHDATGVWFDRFPLTPERVQRAIKETVGA